MWDSGKDYEMRIPGGPPLQPFCILKLLTDRQLIQDYCEYAMCIGDLFNIVLICFSYGISSVFFV